MNFIPFKTFFEQTTDTAITNGSNLYGSAMPTNRISNGPDARGNRTKNPQQTVPNVHVNTNTRAENEFDNKLNKVTQNPTAQEVLGDGDLQNLQNTHGINVNSMQDNQPLQINSKLNAAVVRSTDANGKPVYKLMHYKPAQ